MVGALSVLAALSIWSAGFARGADARVHDYRGVVPILVYHGIDVVPRAGDPYTITQAEFARQMAMLAREGFHAISIAQYARFAGGDAASLPDRPILITFDDGRLDSYQGADAVLARYDLRATMFVITAYAGAAKPGYLTWPQLRAMAGGGRWDVQEHAHAGHVRIPTGPGRRTGPYYANLVYRNGTRETFTAFKRRVTSDILAGRRLMASQIPGFEPLAFAVPYGDYGQHRTNYAPIPAWESGWLQRTFEVFLVQDRQVYNMPGNPIGQRYGVRATTTAETLHTWLREALPQSAWTRPKRPKVRRLRVRRRSVVLVFRDRDGIALKATRRRAGRRHRVRVKVSAGARAHDKGLRPGRVYVYRVVAVDAAGNRSRALRLRVRTHRGLVAQLDRRFPQAAR